MTVVAGNKMEKKRISVVLDRVNSRTGANKYGLLVGRGSSASLPIMSDDNILGEDDEVYIISKGRLVLLNFAWLGIMILLMVMIVAAVPAQIDFLVGGEKKAQFIGLLALICSCVVFVSAPVIGYLSDNSRSKYGRRRVFMAAGAIIGCFGLAGAAVAAPYFTSNQPGLSVKGISLHNLTAKCSTDVPKPKCPTIGNETHKLTNSGHGTQGELALYFLSVCVFFLGSTVVSTAFAGLIADKTHPAARGFSSGVVGGMMLLGNLLGAGLGILTDQLHVGGTFAVVSVIFVVGIAVTCIFTPEKPRNHLSTAKSAISFVDLLKGYARPFKSHDFRWVVITRFLLQMGLATVVGFLQYWLDDSVVIPGCMQPIQAVSILFMPLLILGAVSSTLCGILTDRVRKRKIFVYVAGYGMAAAMVGLAFTDNYWVALGFMAVCGSAYGAYVSVDLAMVMDVLPCAQERAKDLAVWHQSMIFPQLIATPIGGLLVHVFQAVSVGNAGKHGCDYALGYKIVFGVTALYFLTSAILIRKIRNVP